MFEAHILVVDDDEELLNLLNRYLKKNDFKVSTANDGQKALRLLEIFDFDLIVMDVMMPGMDGMEVTQEIRTISAVPVLMLTAMGDTQDRINGLEIGADDYMIKPFEPRELLLRIQSVLRRAAMDQQKRNKPLKFGAYQFDIENGRLGNADENIHLTSAEIAFLRCLGNAPGRIFTRDYLMRICGLEGDDRAVDVLVTRLRRKLEKDSRAPHYLQTVRGRGYRLQPD
ncbi:MAG: response regulator transcription factor [Pseudomonadota bacterium]